jgi:hypothetical protein
MLYTPKVPTKSGLCDVDFVNVWKIKIDWCVQLVEFWMKTPLKKEIINLQYNNTK